MTTAARTLSSRVANFQAVEKSFRYAADPLTRLFDQARLSINSTTVSNVPTSVQDIHDPAATGGHGGGGRGVRQKGRTMPMALMSEHNYDVASRGPFICVTFEP